MNKAIIFSLESLLALTLLISSITIIYTSQYNLFNSNSLITLSRLSKLALDIGEFSELYNNSTTPLDIGFCNSGDITGSVDILIVSDPNSSLSSNNSSHWLQVNSYFKTYNVSICYTNDHLPSIRIVDINFVDVAVAGEIFVMNVSVFSETPTDLTVTINSTLLNNSSTINGLTDVGVFSFYLQPNISAFCYALNLTLNSSAILDSWNGFVCTSEGAIDRTVSIPEYPSILLLFVLIILVIKYD